MLFIRSLVFNILFFGGSLFLTTIMLWSLLLPRKYLARIMVIYTRYVHHIAKVTIGIKFEVRGKEFIPRGESYIIASKHQSAYETFLLPMLLPQAALVMKRELLWFPIWGLYPWRLGFIPINRKSATTAIRSIIKGAEKAKRKKRPIVIFPQGTRVKPGEKAPYKGGLGKVYKDVGLPIVPLALNTGVCWPKNSFIKYPGTVILEFLPPIPAGLPPKEAMQKVEDLIEAHSDAMLTEAQDKA